MSRRAARTSGLQVGTVAVALLSLAAVGVTVPSAAAAPAAGGATTAIAWSPCDPPGDGLDCATVSVPLDWDRPDGKLIDLAVMRHRASRPADRIGTLFVDPGGPGASGVGLVRGAGGSLDEWGDGRFDV